MADRGISERRMDKQVVRSGGEVFSDRSILELVRIPTGHLKFLLWDGKSAKTVEQVVRNDDIFVPLRVAPAILRSLRLPSKALEYGSTRKLFTEISNLISRVTQQSDVVVQVLTFVVFATWLTDSLPFAPFVWILTTSTTTAAPIADVLRLLCRRAVTVSDVSAGLHLLPADLRPTLLTEVFEPTRRVLNLLRASTRRGTLVAVHGKVVDPYCAQIVFAQEPLRDPASAGFPLELALSPTRTYVPPMASSEAEQLAAEYQAKLLQYRLANRAKVGAPAFDLGQFTAPMQKIGYCLGASIVGDDELQARIVPLLKTFDTQVQLDHASLLPAIVLEGLLARCHATTGRSYPVIDLALDVNTILIGRGETSEMSPEKIGWTLRGLGLHTDFISGGRKGLVLANDVRMRIHDLAAAYGVRTLRALPAKIDCPMCAALPRLPVSA